MTIGDLKFALGLDIKPYAEQVKAAIRIAQAGAKGIEDALRMKPPSISVAKVDSEIKKLDATLDKYQSELKQTEAQQNRFATSTATTAAVTNSFRGTLVNFTFVLAYIRQGYRLLTSGLDAVTDAWNRQDVANNKLLNGLKNQGEGIEAFNRLSKQASDLQAITPFADEETMNAQSMLTTFKKSSEEIEILTPRILDLTAAFMKNGESQMDVQQVAVMLGKVNEETMGTLRRIGVAFTAEEEAKLKSTKGTQQAIILAEILDKNFKGMAQTVGNTFAGQMKIAKNMIGDTYEIIGKFIAEAGAPFLKFFQEIVPVIQESVTKVAAFWKETLGMTAAVIGGKNASNDFKKSLIDLIRQGVDFFLSKLKELRPLILDFVKSVKDWITVNRPFLSDLKEIGKALYHISFAIAKINISIITSLVKAMTWVMERVNAVKRFIADIANSTIGKILFPGLQFGSGDEKQSSVEFSVSEDQMHGPPPPKKDFSTSVPSGDKSGSKKESEQKKELNALEQYREQIEKLKKSETELIALMKQENLATDERLQLYIKLLAVQKQLAELQFIGIRDIPGSKTSKDFGEDTFNVRKRVPTEGGGTEGEGKGIQFDREAWAKHWTDGINFATQIIGILNQRPENLFSAFQQLLQIASAIAALMGLASAGPLGAAAGLFGLLGKIIPFNTGGMVPGSQAQNKDSVLSWLTPGELVINRPRVRQLISNFGTGFIGWLNGGNGLLPAIPGHYNSGGIVQNIVSENRSMRSANVTMLNGRILNRRERRRIAKEGLYVESIATTQAEFSS